jgi:hypothetical protein
VALPKTFNNTPPKPQAATVATAYSAVAKPL